MPIGGQDASQPVPSTFSSSFSSSVPATGDTKARELCFCSWQARRDLLRPLIPAPVVLARETGPNANQQSTKSTTRLLHAVHPRVAVLCSVPTAMPQHNVPLSHSLLQQAARIGTTGRPAVFLPVFFIGCLLLLLFLFASCLLT